MHDDFFNLRWVLEHPAAAYTFDPAVWQKLPFRMLTPLLMLSLDLDATLFGLRPAPFYLHQLLALGLAAGAFYATLRLRLPALWSAAGAALFLLGPPLVSLAALIMVRHYVEGLLFALLAVAGYLAALGRSAGRGRVAWSAASAAAYFAAMAAKEVFVPLALLLPLVPEGRLHDRLRLAAPHAAALVLYLAYRLYMLDVLVGGYGWAIAPDELPAAALALPGKMAATAAGGTAWGAVALAALLAPAAWLALRSRRAALLVAAGALLALAPVLPVSQEVVPRYAAVPWAGGALAFAFGAGSLARRGGAGRGAAVGLLAVALAAGLVANRQAWAEAVDEMGRLEVENRGLLELGPDDLLRHPAEYAAALDQLRWLEARLGMPRAAGWFADDVFLCTGGAEGRRVWGYEASAGRLVEITGRVPALRRSYCGALRRDVPLEVSFRRTGEELWWELGPHAAGDWALVLGGGERAIAVPARGGYRIGGISSVRLRVRYRSPEGWVAFSPELLLPLDRPGRYRWRG